MTAQKRAFNLAAPHPERGWSQDVLDLENPFVIPPNKNEFIQSTGILHADGRYCPRGALWRRNRPLTVRPEQPAGNVPTLPGTWLWGGLLWHHFGHFVTESTARLWALPKLRDQIDGIVFTPKRTRHGDGITRFHREFIKLLGPDIPLKVITDPTQVERLFVPGQGFGLGQMSSGTRAFRETMTNHFAKDVPADGPERLYISRSEISLTRGSIVAEKKLESHLRDHGYKIFHPQKHDLVTQIAHYKAAKTILACEGSALHLAGMVAGRHQKVGIIIRRRSSATGFIADHLTSFSGRRPVIFDCLVRSWAPLGATRKHMWLGEHDLSRLQSLLQQHGFIETNTTDWKTFSRCQTQAALGSGFALVASVK
jgi:glycosyl transferase family 61